MARSAQDHSGATHHPARKKISSWRVPSPPDSRKKPRAQVFFVMPNVENVSQKKHTQTHLYPAWASGHTKRSKSPCVTSHCLAIGKGLALSFEWLFNSNEDRSESKLVQAPIRCMRRKRGGFTKYHHPSSKKISPFVSSELKNRRLMGHLPDFCGWRKRSETTC